jgi:DNA invertase Pin-like site-specific DNA recombinase
MLGVFSEFERSMIVARVKAGMARAKAEQAKGIVRRDAAGRKLKAIGRPRLSLQLEQQIKDQLTTGHGILKVASIVGVGSGTVQRIKRDLDV